MTYNFRIPGPLVGAVRTTQRQKFVDPRYAKYNAFKRTVRLLANRAGVPHELNGKSATVRITAFWRKRQRVDGDNAIKSVLDSLWKQDRRVLILAYRGVEFAGDECASVEVEVSEK